MRRLTRTVPAILWLVAVALSAQTTPSITGFRNPTAEIQLEKRFLAVPDPKLAEEHLKILTAAPHVASSPEDRQTAEYVARLFREAGLETEIVPYRVWLNFPAEVSVDVTAPANVKMHGPSREHVDGDDPYQNDSRVLPAFSGSSPSGDIEAEVVYANYGRPEDLQKLKDLGIDVRGKILLVRYGQNYRGVKSLVAQENGAAGVIIYSDPLDDGWFKGDKYPQGPWRPDTGVQRGSVGYMFEFPGDPTTPGVASTPNLPDAQRTKPEQSAEMPKVPTTPLSYHDAWPILQHLAGASVPRKGWQGALPFTYHLGPGPVRVRIHLKQDYAYRTIWNVIGRVPGAQHPEEWVVLGNHRDAWVYGAVDPGSGSAALLETVHGIGALLKSGWHPARTLVFASWDAEEEGLIGSTEWAEQNGASLASAVAYINTDVAVSGPDFGASAVPSLKPFLREASKAVDSPKGSNLYQAWLAASMEQRGQPVSQDASRRFPVADTAEETPVGDLGSGSDYVAFLQHLGVPAADISSTGPYGVYHSVFDNFAWFKKFGDPQFAYVQQQARMLGIIGLRLADTDVLPYDYEQYGKEIRVYLEKAQKKAEEKHGAIKGVDFSAALASADRLIAAGAAAKRMQSSPASDAAKLNRVLAQAERGFLMPKGLPNRPWYKHAIYAPGRYTGYAAVVLPGVNEALDNNDFAAAGKQLEEVTAAISRVAETLESVSKSGN